MTPQGLSDSMVLIFCSTTSRPASPVQAGHTPSLPNQRAVVQPGVVNLELTNTVAPQGFYFAPDPSSQKACTIGGNVAENSGGPHTLAYGVTVNHVTGMEVVLPDGRVVEIGGKALD